MNPEFKSIENFDRLKLGLSAAHIAIKDLVGKQPVTPNQNYPGVVILPADALSTMPVLEINSLELEP